MKTTFSKKIERKGSAPIELALLIPFVLLLGVILFYICHLGVRFLKDESDIRQSVWQNRGSVSLANQHPYQVNTGSLLEDMAEIKRIGSMNGLTQTGYSGLKRLNFLPGLDYNNHTAVVSGTWDAARSRQHDLERGWEKKIGGGILDVNIHIKMVSFFLKTRSANQLVSFFNLNKRLSNGIISALSGISVNQQQAERIDNRLDGKKGEAEKQIAAAKNRKQLWEQKLQSLIPGSEEWNSLTAKINQIEIEINRLELAFRNSNW